jgi:hypothetical protein
MKTIVITPKILPALMVAIITAWFTHPAWAGAVEPTLTLTEVSNTQLNWAWDAAGGSTSGTINTLLPDNWPSTPISGPNLNQSEGFNLTGHALWTEPGNPGFYNLFFLQYFQSTTSIGLWTIFPVISDTSDTSSGFTIFPDSTVADSGFFKFAFVDSAAASEATVPDTGTTFSLFGLSLMGLGFLRRKVC